MTDDEVASQRQERSEVWVLSEGRSASTDYFLTPWLTRDGYAPALIDSRHGPSPEQLARRPSRIIISRYLPATWVGVLEQLSAAGTELIYFMDDDLFDWRALSGLPWRYRWKIARKTLLQYRTIRCLCSEFWVSTAYLAKKYSDLVPRQLSPIYPAEMVAPLPLVRICYHGTSSHPREIAWLQQVMATVQSETENTQFEVFGGAAVRRRFRHIPRVSVMHAMSWSDYLAWSSCEQRDIALAPLLPGPFNAARGPTKFFDYTRMRAAGIYSAVEPYQGFIDDGVDGLLLENNPQRWAEVILALVSDPERRQAIATAASDRLLAMSKA